MVPDSPPLNCPLCRMADSVQKVSALVTAGASTSEVTGYMSGVAYGTGHAGGVFGVFGRTYETGSQQTLLSQRLSPPALPALGSAWSGNVTAAVLGLCFLLLVAYFPVILLAPVAGRMDIAVADTLITLALIVLVIIVAAVQTTVRDQRLRGAWQEQYVRWQAAMARWDALYYCGRDDAVFFPGSPSAVPAAAMWSVL